MYLAGLDGVVMTDFTLASTLKIADLHALNVQTPFSFFYWKEFQILSQEKRKKPELNLQQVKAIG